MELCIPRFTFYTSSNPPLDIPSAEGKSNPRCRADQGDLPMGSAAVRAGAEAQWDPGSRPYGACAQ